MTADEITFSPTHTRFAADLMADCAGELLRITGVLDEHLEWEKVQRARYEQGLVATEPVYGYTGIMVAAKVTVVYAAAYCQWVSDHLVHAGRTAAEIDLVSARRFAPPDDDYLLLRQHEMACDVVPVPSPDPPGFPPALEGTEFLDASVRAKLERVRTLLDEADVAITRSSIRVMQTLHQHTSALAAWCVLAPPHTPSISRGDDELW
ncbi:hypothetical protein [Mycobacterium talmoniae]|uniref:Uncharacterized protein n=1 Tax=Mycobacterium talmoniae TaxID=1858794 RepID=A0A1S1NHS1_9MYCO|nr:hypothetical protein [Mycobacterium talmoniae]OHV03523.1 hypothetical protein BKN37_14465 [Mycobacterium talmoniae]